MSDLSAIFTDLGALLTRIRTELLKKKADKRRISHSLAKEFSKKLVSKGAKLLKPGPKNSNYFCAEISGTVWGISPFASLEGWWDSPSDGFKHMVNERKCRWGVIFFDLKSAKASERKGFWVEGNVFDEKVLKGGENVNLEGISRAESRGYAHSFRGEGEFIGLLEKEVDRKPKTFLRKAKSDLTS